MWLHQIYHQYEPEGPSKKNFFNLKKIQFTYNITLVSSVRQWFDIDSFCIVYIFSSLKLRWINAMAGHNCRCSLLLANINISNIFKSMVYWIQLVEYNFSIIWFFFFFNYLFLSWFKRLLFSSASWPCCLICFVVVQWLSCVWLLQLHRL